MAASKPKANGTVEAPIEVSSLPPVVGINFGNSYASIAVFTKEGVAECIANEDGERQIACAIAFHGEEIYIGNHAKHELVKNSQNTITGFRNLLGKKFSEISQSNGSQSAPVIQHPELPDEPAYKVQVLQAAPKPLPVTATNTPAASHAPTPRSEPTAAERILTVSEVATMFLKSLVQSAEDFLGKKVQGAVISVPSWFSDAQRSALEKVANDAGVKILQLLDEIGAAAATTTTDIWSSDLKHDRTELVVDLGASSLSLALLSIRDGLAYVLASSSKENVGGDQIDEKLIKFFAKEFTKKTKTPIAVCPASDPANKRAEAKLRLAVEHTKRTLSASPGAATCSVESLKDGVDFTGSINRLRFDMEARPIYASVLSAIRELLSSAHVDPYEVDEIAYVGGSTCLPGLDEHLASEFAESIDTPFSLGTVVGGGVGDPTTVLARGCALQAALISSAVKEDASVKGAFDRGSEHTSVKVTSKTVGLLFPDPSSKDEMGGMWVPVLLKETPLPARRTFSISASLASQDSKKVAFEVWEVSEGIRVEKVKPPKIDLSDNEDEEEEEEEEIEVKHRTASKERYLGSLELPTKLGVKAKGKWGAKVEVLLIAGTDGNLHLTAKEPAEGGAEAVLEIPAL